MKNVLLFSLCCLFSLNAIAQTGSIEGKVLDPEFEGEGLIGATVKVFRGDSVICGTVTDFDGYYQLGNLEDGNYALEISYTGVATMNLLFEVSNGNSIDYSHEVKYLNFGGCGGPLMPYKVPLIRIDETWTGQTITSEQIQNMY